MVGNTEAILPSDSSNAGYFLGPLVILGGSYFPSSVPLINVATSAWNCFSTLSFT
jgi:hypothetical protein